jgi:HSP20 family protein
MSKKTDQAVETRDTPATGGVTTLSDWFDHWPDLFARRWPETFRNMPFGPEMFRMEHFYDDDGTFVLRGEMPGIDADKDVTITIDDGQMTIKGERHEHHEVDENDTFRSEFQYGSFHRTVRLPGGACIDDITATYRDGILEVRVPVGEERSAVSEVPISTDR